MKKGQSRGPAHLAFSFILCLIPIYKLCAELKIKRAGQSQSQQDSLSNSASTQINEHVCYRKRTPA